MSSKFIRYDDNIKYEVSKSDFIEDVSFKKSMNINILLEYYKFIEDNKQKTLRIKLRDAIISQLNFINEYFKTNSWFIHLSPWKKITKEFILPDYVEELIIKCLCYNWSDLWYNIPDFWRMALSQKKVKKIMILYNKAMNDDNIVQAITMKNSNGFEKLVNSEIGLMDPNASEVVIRTELQNEKLLDFCSKMTLLWNHQEWDVLQCYGFSYLFKGS